MAGVELHPGDTLDFAPFIPVSMTVLEPPASAPGASRVELRIGVGAPGVLPHVHPKHEERWGVVSGVLTSRVGSEKRAIRPGESLTIAPGVVHGPRNEGDEEVVFRTEHGPDRWFEEYMAEFHALARSGVVRSPRSLGFVLRFALVWDRFREHQQPPPGILRLGFRALLVLGRLRRYPDSYA